MKKNLLVIIVNFFSHMNDILTILLNIQLTFRHGLTTEGPPVSMEFVLVLPKVSFTRHGLVLL